MQEQKASNASSLVARIGVWNLIWLGILGVLLLAAAITWLWPYRALPTASWRDMNSNLPWKNDSICVEGVSGYWKSAKGNERMVLRAACYPVAEIELGESEGSGMLYISFTDENDHQAGDTISLYYNKGEFRPRKEVNIEASGNKACVFVEAGYDKETEYKLHMHDESQQLWRINLYYRPDGTTKMNYMGSETIPATLLK